MELNAKLVELKDIRPSQHNARKTFDEVKLKELAASIKEKGVIEPIIIRPANGKYEVVCGERRFRASQMAGVTTIPAVIKELDEKQAIEYQIIENLHREDVHPLEEAEAYELLINKHGYKTVEDLAVKVGKSKGYVYGRLKLCELIPDNRKLFYEGKLSPSVALLIARIPPHLQKEAGKKASSGGSDNEPMSYRRAQEFISNEFMLVLKAAPFDTDDAMLVESTGSCTMCSKRTGNQKELFPDIASADVCTDPVCFKSKKEAGVKRALAKAKESGKIILSEREAKKVFFSEDSMHLGEGYINLETTCEEDKQGRKYKQLVRSVKDAKIVVGVNPFSGELVALLHRSEASRIRKLLNIVQPKKAEKPAKASKAQSEKETQREQETERIRQEVSGKVIEEIIQSARRDTKQSFLRIMAECMCQSFLTPVLAVKFLKRHEQGLEVNKNDAISKVEEHLDIISDSELPIFCLELMMCEESEFDEESRIVKALAKHYNIDPARIKKTAEKDSEKKDVSTAAPATQKKEPEEAHVKMRSGNEFEYNGRGGKKVVVKSKEKLSLDDQKKTGAALKQVTDLMAEEK